MAEVKWGDVTADTPLDRLTAQPQLPPPSAAAAPPLPLPPSSSSASPTANSDAGVGQAAEGRQPPPPSLPSSTASPSPTPSVSVSAVPLPSLSPPPPSLPPSSVDAAVTALTASLSSSLPPPSAVVESKDEEDPLPLLGHSGGLHPHDATAEVLVREAGLTSSSSSSSSSIYQAAETFEQLGLSKELLAGVVELRFTKPSKIQAQALPLILSPQHPNLIGQAHHGSGKVPLTAPTHSNCRHRQPTAAAAHSTTIPSAASHPGLSPSSLTCPSLSPLCLFPLLWLRSDGRVFVGCAESSGCCSALSSGAGGGAHARAGPAGARSAECAG